MEKGEGIYEKGTETAKPGLKKKRRVLEVFSPLSCVSGEGKR